MNKMEILKYFVFGIILLLIAYGMDSDRREVKKNSDKYCIDNEYNYSIRRLSEFKCCKYIEHESGIGNVIDCTGYVKLESKKPNE